MARLTRLFVLLVTRLGLFLSIVAWFVSQAWLISLESPFGIVFTIASEGACIRSTYSESWLIETVELGDDVQGMNWAFDLPPPRDKPYSGELVHFSFCYAWGACVTDESTGEIRVFSIRHWFVCTLFTLFYVTVQLMYRAQPTKQSPSQTKLSEQTVQTS